ncbi:MAG: hypothetical protein K5683_06580 [Prevotella sp.]|nr:hypothetical protein [Prevotella sp.]
MDKETKELLKRTLSMTDDKLLLKFAKSYAAKDQAFAEAIIEKFLPVENALDMEKMVKDCFLHKKKGGRRRYGSSLDWAAIRKDIKRLLKQLDYLRQQQDGEKAAEGALLLLETLEVEFNNDCAYVDYNYSNSNFGNDVALSLVGDILQNDKHIHRDKKLGLLRRLERLSDSDVYSTYLPCDIDQVINEAKMRLLSPDDLLKEIDKNIKAAQYDSSRAEYVEWKINVLYEQHRDQEAEQTIMQYLRLEGIAIMRYEQLVAGSHFDEAKAFCRRQLVIRKDLQQPLQPWHERLLEMGQQTDDVEMVRNSSRWLFAYGNVSQDDKREFYRICRETFDASDWPAFRDKMLIEGKNGNASTETIFRLYKEEGLFGQMYQDLQKMSDSFGYYSYSPYLNSGGQRLVFFCDYASCLTEEQRKKMVADFAKTILLDSRRAKDRERYGLVASGLHLLSKSSEEGSQQARTLADQILRENPKKPAYREEISRYDY